MCDTLAILAKRGADIEHELRQEIRLQQARIGQRGCPLQAAMADLQMRRDYGALEFLGRIAASLPPADPDAGEVLISGYVQSAGDDPSC